MNSSTATLPNRSFGGLIVVVLLVYGAFGAWRGHRFHELALVAGLVVLVPTVFRPALLAPFTRAWLGLGKLMHAVVSPVTLGLVFFGVITPVAAVLKLMRRDALARRFEPAAPTYWIERDPPGPDLANLPRQF